MKFLIIILGSMLALAAEMEENGLNREKRKSNVYIEVDLDEGPDGKPGDGSRVILLTEHQVSRLIRDFKGICERIASFKHISGSNYNEPPSHYPSYHPQKPYERYPENSKAYHDPSFQIDPRDSHAYSSNEEVHSMNNAEKQKQRHAFYNHPHLENSYPTVVDGPTHQRQANFMKVLRDGFYCTTCNRNKDKNGGKKEKMGEGTKVPRSLDDSREHPDTKNGEPEKFSLDLPPMNPEIESGKPFF